MMTRKRYALSLSPQRVNARVLDSNGVPMTTEPIEPLPEKTSDAIDMIEKRQAHFMRNYGSLQCHNCPNEDLSFAEPWAQCSHCGWIEGY